MAHGPRTPIKSPWGRAHGPRAHGPGAHGPTSPWAHGPKARAGANMGSVQWVALTKIGTQKKRPSGFQLESKSTGWPYPGPVRPDSGNGSGTDLERICNAFGTDLEHLERMWNEFGTHLEQIWNTFGTDLEHLQWIWNAFGTDLERTWNEF